MGDITANEDNTTENLVELLSEITVSKVVRNVECQRRIVNTLPKLEKDVVKQLINLSNTGTWFIVKAIYKSVPNY